jgi:hypothetical protein
MGKYTRYDGKAGRGLSLMWEIIGVMAEDFVPQRAVFGGHFQSPENALLLQGAPAQVLALTSDNGNYVISHLYINQ